MIGSSQRKQVDPTAQPVNEGDRMKLQRALSLLQLLIGETIALFIAGIAVPSFLRSGTATNHALATGSLHTLTIGPVTFSYTSQNLGFAILGALCGAATALAIDSPATIANIARIVRMLRKNSRRSYTVSRLSDDRLARLSIVSYEQGSGVLVLTNQFENRPTHEAKVPLRASWRHVRSKLPQFGQSK